MSSPPCVTDSHTNMETIMQNLLNVIINTMECDGRGFIFVPEPCTYAPIMTGSKGKGEMPTAELWTDVLSYRYQTHGADVVPGPWEVLGEACLAFSQAPGCGEV